MAVASLQRQVLDALPIAVSTADIDGRITSVNRAWSRFARTNGASRAERQGTEVGTPIWDAIGNPGLRGQVEPAMASLREGRATSLAWEFGGGSPNTERTFLMQVTALGGTHAVSGYAFSIVDVTAVSRSRDALLDASLGLARTTTVDRVLHEIAQQIRRITACDAVAIALAADDAMTLRLAHSSGHSDSAEDLERRLAPVWAEALGTGGMISRTGHAGVEITAPITDDERVVGAVTLSATTPPLPHQFGDVQRVLAAIAGETAAAIERARLVRQREHACRIEAIGEVSTGVAHELRNPLSGISSAAQLLRFRVKDDPVVEKNVGRILREVERLNGMVSALLEYGRPNPIRLEPGNPDVVWDEVLDAQRGRLESRALLLHRVRAEPPARCAIDGAQLSQVLVNLLANATDAAPEGSDLTLETERLPNGAWRCRLHNDGPAIPPDVLPRVFEMFFSTKAGETGIGLALCQRIIEDHHGTITLENAPGGGATATILLPAAA